MCLFVGSDSKVNIVTPLLLNIYVTYKFGTLLYITENQVTAV